MYSYFRTFRRPYFTRAHSGVRETPQIDHMVWDTVIEGFYTGNTLFLRAHNSAHPRTTIYMIYTHTYTNAHNNRL